MLRKNIQLVALLAGTLFFALITSGCEQKTINDIMAEPTRYANKEIAVVGNVVWSTSILGKGAYKIEDGTGNLWVISTAGVPRKGAKIVVKGTVRDAYDLSSFHLPDAISSGLVLIEKSHRAR